MFDGLRLKGRREKLERLLAADVFQSAGWEPWLASARSVRELHERCPDPGWLTYCAYLAGASQDQLLEGTLALARLAAEGDPDRLVPMTTLDDLQDCTWPDLAQLILSLEERYPVARALTELMPSAVCYVMMPLYDGRIALREARGEVDRPAALHPYRGDPTALVSDDVDGFFAAGYVFAFESVFCRHQGLRNSLALRAAAAASLLQSGPTFRTAALARLRVVYCWSADVTQ